LKELNALVMKPTGSITNALGGTFDSSKSDFRLCGVTTGYGGKSYKNYLKVPDAVSKLSIWKFAAKLVIINEFSKEICCF
jgi:hypothetical protein